MAWNPVVRPVGTQRAFGVGGALEAIDQGTAAQQEVIANTAKQRSAIAVDAASRRAPLPSPEPAEFAFNDQTGEVLLPNGAVVKANAPTMVRLATLTSKDGTPLPKLDPSMVPDGFRMYSQAQLASDIDSIPDDSDFWGELASSFKTGVGLAGSALDALIGNDDPSNAMSKAGQQYTDQQTIGQYKASNSPWFSGIDSFISGLGQTLGNVGSSVATAAPALITGGVVGSAAGPEGTAAGAISAGGMALSGGAQAFGEQATDFYDTAMEAMSKMEPEQLEQESPLYQRIVAEHPGITHEEAMREVAIQGARSAGMGGALPGAVEAVIGGRLAGNLLAKMGFRTALAGVGKTAAEAAAAAAKSTTRKIGEGTARATAAAVGAGASEMAETGFGQAAGARTTGIGDPTFTGNLDIREGIAASQAGFLFGALGGRANARDDLSSALDVAGKQSPNTAGPQPTASPQQVAAANLEVPAFLRRGIMVGPGGAREEGAPVGAAGQGELGLDIPAGFNMDSRAGQPPSATDVAPLSQEAPAPVADPAQQDLLAQPAPLPASPEVQQRQFARQAFAEFFGIDPDNPDALVAAMPELLDLADQYPQVKAVMQAAGVYPNMLEQSPESQQAAAAQAQQEFAAAPAPGGAPLRVGNQVPVPPGAEQSVNMAGRVRGPESAQRAAVQMAVPAQVESPEPLAAPAERTPDGRPVGVAPAPMENPEPMSPQQAQQAAQTRAQRRAEVGAPPSPVDDQNAASEADVAAAAAASEQQVSPSTPEPIEDIGAQLDAMSDPASARQAVFVAHGNEAQIPMDRVPPDAFVAKRRYHGTLITYDEREAKRFRTGKWTDADTARVLGYSETKADVIAAGQEPVVVEARTPEGAVAAQQIATPRNARAAAVAVKKQARAGAQVVATTPQQAQADRSARVLTPTTAPAVPTNPRAAKVAAKKAERPTPPKAARVKLALQARREEEQSKKKSVVPALAQKGLAVATDKENKRAPRSEERDATTLDDVAIARTKITGPSKPAPRLDLSAFAKNRPSTITSRNRPIKIPDSLLYETGEPGAVVDLRVQAVDEELRARLQGALAGKLSAADAAEVERVLRNMAQLDTMLDAAVDAAEERLLDRLDKSAEGNALLEASKAIALREQLRKRRAARAKAGKSARGRPLKTARKSPLLFVQLLAEEMYHFGRLVRKQARAEAANPVEPARSVARRLIAQILPNMTAIADNPDSLHDVVTAFGNLTDEQLDGYIALAAHWLKGSPLAKQVMRGTSEVAHAAAMSDAGDANKIKQRSAEAEIAAQAEAEIAAKKPVLHLDPYTPEQLGLTENKGQRTTSYEGDLPAEAIATIEGWAQLLERAGTKMSGALHVLSSTTAHLLYPDAFPNSEQWGRYAKVDVDGKPVYVLAVNWDTIASDAHALEVLAHEFGHYVSHEVYRRSDRATQEAVYAAYENWLAANGHLQPLELFRSHAPQLLKTVATEAAELTHAYASSFAEWSANHVARFLLTRPEPKGIVEKYFARIADVLRSIWADLTGSSQPDAAWAAAMDNWIARGAADNAVPVYAMPDGPHNMEIVGEPGAEPATPEGMKLGARATQRVTHGIAAGKAMWGEAMRKNPKGFRENAVAIAGAIYKYVMEGRAGDLLREAGLSLMTLDQLVKKFEGTLVGGPLKAWATLQRKASQLANIALHGGELSVLGEVQKFVGASDALDRAYKLSAPVRRRLENLMYDTTRYGVHPDVPFGGTASGRSNKHLIESGGQPLGERAIARNRQRYDKIMADWEAMVAVDAEAADVYLQLRQAFVELHEKSLAAKKANLMALYGDHPTPAEKATLEKALARIEEAHLTHQRGPYFPLARKGNWIVTATLPAESHFVDSAAEADALRRDLLAMNPGASVMIDDDEGGKKVVQIFRRSVQFFESQREANNSRQAMLDELRSEYEVQGATVEDVAKALSDGKLLDETPGSPQSVLDVLVSQARPKLDYFASFNSTGTFLSELRAKLRAEGSKIDPVVAGALEEAFIEAMPELSPRKSMLPRENILGASRDMLSAYAIRYHGAAHSYAHIVYGKDINDARAKIKDLKDEFAPAGKLFTVLEKSQRAIQSQMEHTLGNRVQNALQHASALAFLAFSPAYVLMNTMQPTMVTLPILAGMQVRRNGKRETLGMVRAGEYLRQAYDGTLPHFSKRAWAEFADETRRLFDQKSEGKSAHDIATAMINRFGKSGEEKQMLQSLLENGRLDFSFLNTIEDAMRDSAVERKLANVSRLGMAIPQQVEAMNRVVTALATYRIATKEQGMAHAEAMQAASDVVGSTQIDYSKLNRPLLLNKQGFRVILQFKMYVQGMYALFVQNAAQWATGKISAEQQAELDAIKDIAERNAKQAEFEADNRRQGRASLLYLMGTHGAVGGVAGMGPIAAAAKLGIGLAAFAMGGDDGDDEWKSSEQLLTETARSMFGEKGGLIAERGLFAGLLGVDVADRVGFPNLVDTKFMGIRESDDAGTQLDKWLIYSLGAPYANLRRIVKGVGAGLDDDPYTYMTDGLPAGARAVAKAFRASRSGVLDRDGDTFIPREDLSWGDIGIKALGLTPTAESKAYRVRTEEKGTVARIQARKALLLKRWRTSPDERKALREEIRAFNETVPKGFQISPSALSKSVKAKKARDAGEVDRNTQAVREYLQ